MPKKQLDKTPRKRDGKMPGIKDINAAIEQLKVKDAVKEKLDPAKLPQKPTKKTA